MANVNDSRNLSNEIVKERERLADADLSEEDRDAIERFANYRDGRVARNTLRQDMGNLRRAAEATEGNLIDSDRRSDIDAIMATLKRQGVEKPESRNAYLRAIRQFLKWLTDEPDYPSYEWIDGVEDYDTNDETRRLKKEEYLTESEVTTLREQATHPREEALVEFLADTGSRINLVCNLRRKDIELDGKHPTFRPNPNAKDGYKGVEIKRYPIHYSERHLRRWKNKRHPDKHPDAPLFPVKIAYDKDDRQNMAMHAQTAFDSIKSLADDTEIDRDRVSPHAFRHAAVRRMKTDPNFDFDWETVKLRTAWSDQAFESMKELYGALEEGEQLDYFAGRAGRDVGEEDEQEAIFIDCRFCGEENRRDANFCDRCGKALNDEAEKEKEEIQEQSEESIVEVEDETEAKVVQAVLKDLRENPAEFFEED